MPKDLHRLVPLADFKAVLGVDDYGALTVEVEKIEVLGDYPVSPGFNTR
ncbi:MAG: hypothetical protein LBQ88_21310 [Treponema sp.]|jgi:hypothetical protein|nr:hypothetical protein [Treponema sp.]